jgi:hypothetical protein
MEDFNQSEKLYLSRLASGVFYSHLIINKFLLDSLGNLNFSVVKRRGSHSSLDYWKGKLRHNPMLEFIWADLK